MTTTDTAYLKYTPAAGGAPASIEYYSSQGGSEGWTPMQVQNGETIKYLFDRWDPDDKNFNFQALTFWGLNDSLQRIANVVENFRGDTTDGSIPTINGVTVKGIHTKSTGSAHFSVQADSDAGSGYLEVQVTISDPSNGRSYTSSDPQIRLTGTEG